MEILQEVLRIEAYQDAIKAHALSHSEVGAAFPPSPSERPSFADDAVASRLAVLFASAVCAAISAFNSPASQRRLCARRSGRRGPRGSAPSAKGRFAEGLSFFSFPTNSREGFLQARVGFYFPAGRDNDEAPVPGQRRTASGEEEGESDEGQSVRSARKPGEDGCCWRR